MLKPVRLRYSDEPESGSSTSRLEHEWQKRLYPSFVGGIFLRKVTQEETFFLLQFDPEANEEKQESHEGDQQAGRNGGPSPMSRWLV